MLIRPLPLITLFLDALNQSLQSIKPSARLTKTQKLGLSFILMGIIITGELNWASFERKSLKRISSSRLRYFFRYAKISWQLLLQASIRRILSHYDIKGGVLAIDDTDKKRAKNTSTISGSHKVKDKATGGYFNGQELIFMVLITDVATFPVGFRFYVPDPAMSDWIKNDKKFKKNKIPRSQRPVKPKIDRYAHPTKQMLALNMLREFVDNFPQINVKSVLADALYGTKDFMNQAVTITGGAQVVSQLRSNQRVSSKNSNASVKDYFSRQPGVKKRLIIRGGKTQEVTLLAARLNVKAHGERRFIVALKYEGEDEYRYLIASDLSWRHEDIARLYTLRWLVEVFIQDWKAHGGWNKLTKQQGIEGSTHGVILSLLCDHLLLLHPEQSVRLKNKQPGMPVGCLTERLKAEALIEEIHEVVSADDPLSVFELLKQALQDCLPTRDSKKHMSGRDLGRQESTSSLDFYAKAA